MKPGSPGDRPKAASHRPPTTSSSDRRAASARAPRAPRRRPRRFDGRAQAGLCAAGQRLTRGRAGPAAAPPRPAAGPRPRRRPAPPAPRRLGASCSASFKMRRRPAVCAGVTTSSRRSVIMRLLHGRLVPSPQDDVEAVAKRPFGSRGLDVEGGDQSSPCALLRNREIDRIERQERIPGKYICVTRRVRKFGPNREKWMCAGRQALRGGYATDRRRA